MGIVEEFNVFSYFLEDVVRKSENSCLGNCGLFWKD